MYQEKIENIKKLLKPMALPERRKDVKNRDNIRWLLRNLGVRNKEHPNFEPVVALLKEVV
jgi:hypothetical protein